MLPPLDKVKTAPCAILTEGKGLIVTVELAIPDLQ